MLATVIAFFLLFGVVFEYLDPPLRGKPATLDQLAYMAYYLYVYGWSIAALTLGSWMAFVAVNDHDTKTDAEYEKHLRKVRSVGYKIALGVTPFGLVFLALCGVGWALARVPQFVAKVVNFVESAAPHLARFVAGVFVSVHSSRRTLCFVDATLGAAVGYTFGSTLVGVAAGVILGVVNYELVSVRWLKLAPQTIRS